MVSDDIEWFQTVGQYAADAPAWTRIYDTKDNIVGMTLDDLIPSKFLKKSDLGDDEHIVTIRKITKTNVARDDKPPEYKATLTFDEFAKPMVANKTNLKRIAAALGDDLELWVGKQIKVFYDPDVAFGDEVTGGIRVRGLQRKVARPALADDEEVNRKLRDAEPRDDIPF